MYFITTICAYDNSFDSWSSRTVGYYFDRERAIAKVMVNYLDMWETVYEYAVIQKFGEGYYPEPEEEIWFEFDPIIEEYREVSKPEIFNGYQFGIG